MEGEFCFDHIIFLICEDVATELVLYMILDQIVESRV